MNRSIFTCILTLSLLITSLLQFNCFAALENWNEGKTKEAIINFVNEVTDKSSDKYIKPVNRIAVFDNDGTVQPEKPFAFVDMFALVRVRNLALKQPEYLSEIEPDWKSDKTIQKLMQTPENKLLEILKSLKYDDLLKLFILANSKDSQKNINSALHNYAYNFIHPRFKKTPAELVYKPMVELIEYLKENKFTVYFVSGSTADYLRQFSENIGIPKSNDIGWTFNGELRKNKNGSLYMYKLPETVNPISNNEGKPVNIERYIGRKPVIAVGNSSGDISMLTYTKENNKPSLCLVVEHNDPQREYEYDFGPKVRNSAAKQGWYIISMKKDFKVVF